MSIRLWTWRINHNAQYDFCMYRGDETLAAAGARRPFTRSLTFAISGGGCHPHLGGPALQLELPAAAAVSI